MVCTSYDVIVFHYIITSVDFGIQNSKKYGDYIPLKLGFFPVCSCMKRGDAVETIDSDCYRSSGTVFVDAVDAEAGTTLT